MKIKLLAFASASEALGAGELDYLLDSDDDIITVAHLKLALTREFPRLEELWQRLAVSVDGEIVSDVEQLVEGAEVALLPPVSGG